MQPVDGVTEGVNEGGRLCLRGTVEIQNRRKVRPVWTLPETLVVFVSISITVPA